MALGKSYIINQTLPFEMELEDIYNYIVFKFKNPIAANNFYKKITNKVYSLEFLPDRHTKVYTSKKEDRNLRKFYIDNYVIIYEVDNNTRTSFYFTYISLIPRLFKSNIINL